MHKYRGRSVVAFLGTDFTEDFTSINSYIQKPVQIRVQVISNSPPKGKVGVLLSKVEK